ncbi:A-kinase anchor protein inhibitor 1 [Vulpes lagopus]|uniref:A-kinase anchor protein inhibitor 1 n=1 Tax=Vulpes lagopus TaxID=494514 RepID=UPI001BCA5144|nr:A-kinase anchor protein inhibitor 1 [Vulpes lagopus]
MRVDLIQSVPGLKRKDSGSLRKKEFFLRTVFGLKTATSYLPWVSRLPTCPIKGGFAGSHNCEKPGNEPEEVKLQKASKQIVQNAILQAVQQVSQESQQRGERTSDSRGSLQLGVGELTKKHEKK